MSSGYECITLLAVQFTDDQNPRVALIYAIEQQGAEDVDVLHVFDDRSRFVGRWIRSDLLNANEVDGLSAGRDTWHKDEAGVMWGFIEE